MYVTLVVEIRWWRRFGRLIGVAAGSWRGGGTVGSQCLGLVKLVPFSSVSPVWRGGVTVHLSGGGGWVLTCVSPRLLGERLRVDWSQGFTLVSRWVLTYWPQLRFSSSKVYGFRRFSAGAWRWKVLWAGSSMALVVTIPAVSLSVISSSRLWFCIQIAV